MSRFISVYALASGAGFVSYGLIKHVDPTNIILGFLLIAIAFYIKIGERHA